MKRRSSKTFLAEVTDRVVKLQQASHESGLDMTDDLMKTLNQLSEISRGSSFSEDSEDYSKIDESVSIQQPENSMISLNDTSLITSIKKKNQELKKDCSEKINELRTTTREFCSVNFSKKTSLIAEEATAEKTNEVRNRAKTLPDYPEKPMHLIYNELNKIKCDLALANRKIVESQNEILKQKNENFELKDQIHSLVEASNESNARKICECIIS
jgi:hypothetical protein